ncbi:TetR/AcrR family transcriptional regulator [Streptomyces sp. NPDC050504]|uniref:TetR/AcrR family transcriptional regulator n=1 Tax=Streptomyces sp. NPDC050504 TaxID=3365618 RepID=UPI003792C4EA
MLPADRTSRPSRTNDLSAVADLLWRVNTDHAEEPRPRLSAKRIVGTAIALADVEGLDALSMQRIASEMGCTAMALYRHIPSKNQLLAAMTDAATGRPPTPAAAKAWRSEVEGWADALWGLYLRHPWILQTPRLSAPVGPNELAWFEALLSPLHRAGLDRGDLIPLATFISSAVRDLARVATELDPEGAAAYGQVLAERLDPQLFPTLCSLAGGDGLDEAEDGDVTPIVHLGMQRLLDGIEARAHSNSSSAPDKEERHG